MPDTNESNKLKEPSMPDANKLMPDTYEDEDEVIIDDEELEEPSPSWVPEKLPAGANKAKKTQDGYKNGLNYINIGFLPQRNYQHLTIWPLRR